MLQQAVEKLNKLVKASKVFVLNIGEVKYNNDNIWKEGEN